MLYEYLWHTSKHDRLQYRFVRLMKISAYRLSASAHGPPSAANLTAPFAPSLISPVPPFLSEHAASVPPPPISAPDIASFIPLSSYPSPTSLVLSFILAA